MCNNNEKVWKNEVTQQCGKVAQFGYMLQPRMEFDTSRCVRFWCAFDYQY